MFLRTVTIFRLMVYALALTYAAALGLSFFGLVGYPPAHVAFSGAVMLAVCFAVNAAFAKVFAAKSNPESVAITGLILALIVSPFGPGDWGGLGYAIFAAAWATASKYMLAHRGRHLFNPAALGVALAGLVLHRSASWWVGDYIMLWPPIVLAGVLVVLRMRYTDMLMAFALGVAAATVLNRGWEQAATSLSLILLHSMFVFFAFVMLTEPRTAPMGRWRRVIYGLLVAVMFAPSVHIGSYYFTPEIALLAGNLFAFLTDKRRLQRTVDRVGFGAAAAP